MNDEEREVLKSIYEADPNFTLVNDNTFQYKILLDNDRFYLIEIQWPDDYPNVIPIINLELFSNRLLTSEFKSKLLEKLNNEATEQLGMPMTYTLFEVVKDFTFDGDIFQSNQISSAIPLLATTMASDSSSGPSASSTLVKKEQLTKAQKRRQWNHRVAGDEGQKARGHDWVDIVRHLSQSGNKIES